MMRTTSVSEHAISPKHPEGVKGLGPKICLALAQLFTKTPLQRLSMRNRALGERFESTDKYVADRVSHLREYQDVFGDYGRFAGKTVMELGCSAGYLLSAFREQEEFTAIGADIDAGALDRAREAYGDRIQFVQTTPASVPLPDASVDLAYCIDTVEHLSKAREILLDCHRVLRPGGLFLIHFHPWFGPWGSHLEDIIPFPWPHVLFSMDTLLNVAARIYDSPGYTPACYWFDEAGRRRPNPYLDHERWDEFLNRMTIIGFRRLIKSMPYKVIEFRRLGFGGKAYKAGRLLKGLAHVPLLDEFFLRAVLCVLQKS